MKIRVRERFVDRITREIREAGRVYDYTKGRAEEIIRAGYAEPADDLDTKGTR